MSTAAPTWFSPPRALARQGLDRRLMPFVLVALGAVAISPFLQNEGDGPLFLLGAVATVLIAASAVLPWHRFPAWLEAAPPIGYYLVIAVLRHAEGGAGSGFAPLAYLPVIWLALYGTRRQMVVALVAMAATFVTPILVFGEPLYPENEWRRAILAVSVASLVGFTAQALVGAVRHGRAEAEERAARLAETAAELGRALESERLLLASSAHMIVATTPEGTIVKVNPAAERLLGRNAAELVGTRLADLLAPGETLNLGDAPTSIRERETFLARSDGTRLAVSLTVTDIRTSGGDLTGFLGVARDISEERRLRNRLEEREAILASVLAASPDPITLLDVATGTVSFTSAVGKEIVRDTDLASPHAARFDVVHADDIDAVKAALGDAVRTGDSRVRARVRFADASLRPVEFSIRRLGEEGSSTVVMVAREIGEQLRWERELSEARAAAESANKAKTAFLSNMSHELRTPLNSILGFGQLLQGSLPDGDARKQVDNIVGAGRHLHSLIADLLDIAAIEAGRMDLDIAPVELRKLLEDVAELLRPAADRGQVELSIRMPSRRVWVSADQRRLRQSLINLVGNSIKFNHSRGFVEVTCSARAGRVRIEVRDSSGGIAAGDLPRLFTAFERLGPRRSSTEGSGLGLALTRSLVHAMNGRIGVETEEGVGSTFWIELERARRPSSAVALAAGKPLQRTRRTGRYTVVQIEDNEANASLVAKTLALRPDVRLVTASDGAAGLDLVRANAPRLILLDLDLPDISGTEVLARLRANPLTSEVPVVIVSADASPGRARELEAAGANGYLTKPIDVPRLLAIVDAVAPLGDAA